MITTERTAGNTINTSIIHRMQDNLTAHLTYNLFCHKTPCFLRGVLRTYPLKREDPTHRQTSLVESLTSKISFSIILLIFSPILHRKYSRQQGKEDKPHTSGIYSLYTTVYMNTYKKI